MTPDRDRAGQGPAPGADPDRSRTGTGPGPGSKVQDTFYFDEFKLNSASAVPCEIASVPSQDI